MKKTISVSLIAATIIFGCTQKKYGDFTVSGKVSNGGSQKIYLQELPFAGSEPLILDSATLQANGKFELSATALEEGLYRLSLERGPEVLLINDEKNININIDVNYNFNFNLWPGTHRKHHGRCSCRSRWPAFACSSSERCQT